MRTKARHGLRLVPSSIAQVNATFTLPSGVRAGDGKYHLRYPNGNLPNTSLAAIAHSSSSASLGNGAAIIPKFYISPTGDDNNNGTLSSPWSITALADSTKWAAYSAQVIGLLPGTYQYGTKGGAQTTLYSIYQNTGVINSSTAAVLPVNGGTSPSSPTYLCSCDSLGNYSPRTATIDCSDPSTGALPTVEGSVMGQNQYQPLVYIPRFGNVTVDGLRIKNFTFSALAFYGSSGTPSNNIVIKNCELSNGQNVVSNNNPGAIWLDFCSNSMVENCLIHDIGPTSNSSYQDLGYIQFNSHNNSVKNCTFYNCSSVSLKDGWQHCDVSYCYIDWGVFGSAYSGTSSQGAVENYLADTGYTGRFHHNIVIGLMFCAGESSQQNNGTVLVYNNTFYKPTSAGGKLVAFSDYLGSANTGGNGNFQLYDNLVFAQDGQYDGGGAEPGAFAKMSAKTGGSIGAPGWSTLTNTDYNAYGVGMTFGQDFNAGDTGWSLATWQGYGYDAHATTLSASPFVGTPQSHVPTSFAITGPALTASSSGGPCGACDANGNASDGSGIIGCDFT